MENNPVFQIQAELFKAETKRNNAIRLQFDSQENVSPEALKRMFEWREKPGWLLFASRIIRAEDLLSIPDDKPVEDDEKSPSQRMRGVMYRAWEKNKRGYDDFNLYYRYRMERIINKIKEELE